MAATIARANRDIAIPSRTKKLQTPALPVRLVKRSTAGRRTLRGKR